MSFTNSEQLYGVKTLYVSGGNVGVTTGAGVYFGLVTTLISGGLGPATGIITVYDGVSGGASWAPHAAGTLIPKLYDYYYIPATSGLVPPDQWQPQPFLSGLNVIISGAANIGVTISYRLGL